MEEFLPLLNYFIFIVCLGMICIYIERNRETETKTSTQPLETRRTCQILCSCELPVWEEEKNAINHGALIIFIYYFFSKTYIWYRFTIQNIQRIPTSSQQKMSRNFFKEAKMANRHLSRFSTFLFP